MKNVMLDLETMGTRPNAPVISIGAVEFDADRLGGRFYAAIDMVTSGGVPDMDTVRWWLCQSNEAREAVTCGDRPLLSALAAFSNWFPEDAVVWGNGANFDNVILRETYLREKELCPWSPFNDRCYRTVKSLFPAAPKPERAGTAHNAIADAVFQAEHLISINRFYDLGIL